MALTANDIVIFLPPTIPTLSTPPEKGWVIVTGANPEIIWMRTGVRAVYTAIAAPAGVIRTAAAPAADFTTWMHSLVQPISGATLGNPSGRSRGIVREVLLTGDPPATLSLIVQCIDNEGKNTDEWYFIAASVAERI
jgi:hypothetical protein